MYVADVGYTCALVVQNVSDAEQGVKRIEEKRLKEPERINTVEKIV